jgi:UDP-2,4-diacetamido-2,4,6-trideoxy-beta-L-altropyranose hydrolase
VPFIAKSNKQCATYKNISAKELQTLIASCHIAVCPASSLAIECCAVGIGLFCGYTVDNQINSYKGLSNKNLIFPLENLTAITQESLQSKLENTSIQDITQRIELQKAYFTPEVAERYINLCSTLPILTYRTANRADTDLLFSWANDPLTRQSSFHSNEIAYNTHCAWLEKKLQDPLALMYIFETPQKTPIGLVRFDIEKNTATIGIVIAPEQRGKKYASRMLQYACNDFFKNNPTCTIQAYIKKENTASISSFTQAGFHSPTEILVEGIESIILHKTKDL